MINRFKKYYNVDNDAVIVPPPEENVCYPFYLEASDDTNISFDFTACGGSGGGGSSITVPANSNVTICAISVESPAAPSIKWRILIGSSPCEE